MKNKRKNDSDVTYIGNGKVIDVNGEIHKAPEILKKTKHENFIKVEFMAMTAMINHIGNKKMKVAQYIMNHMSLADNQLVITQKELADRVGVSLVTVEQTIQSLRKAKLIQTRTGAIMLSPHLDSRGYPKHYGYLLVKFSQFGKKRNKKGRQKKD